MAEYDFLNNILEAFSDLIKTYKINQLKQEFANKSPLFAQYEYDDKTGEIKNIHVFKEMFFDDMIWPIINSQMQMLLKQINNKFLNKGNGIPLAEKKIFLKEARLLSIAADTGPAAEFPDIKRYLVEMIDLIDRQNKKERKSVLVSYKWDVKKYDALQDLFKGLKGKLIDKSVASKTFKAIFSEKGMDTISPVKWHDDNASELLYFIIQLQEKKYIPDEKPMNYERMKACFVKNDGSPFNANFKALKQSLKSEGTFSKEKKGFIDNILKNLPS